MTRFDINVILKLATNDESTGKAPVHAAVAEGDIKMSKVVKPVDAANYLVMLYKQTMYECNKQKLQKLIFIADVLYYINSGYTERMVSETDITASARGISVDAVSTGIYALVFNFYNERNTININEVNKDSKMPLHPKYSYNTDALNENECNVLYKAFIEFGAYSGKDLTLMSQNLPIWQKIKERTTNNMTIELYNHFYKDKDEKTFINELKQIINDLSNNSQSILNDIMQEIVDVKKD